MSSSLFGRGWCQLETVSHDFAVEALDVDSRLSQTAELRGSGGQRAVGPLPRVCRWCYDIHRQHFAGCHGDAD